ncbi:MAG: hypothetical protein KDG50_07690 [Chromatiales bacterium]|nr:hypothetical protein [Chromatiales bacterium]
MNTTTSNLRTRAGAAMIGLVLAGAALQAPAALLGVNPGYPQIQANGAPGGLTYDATTDLFSAVAPGGSARFSAANSPVPVLGGTITMNIVVDGSGALVGGVPGNDLVVTGTIPAAGGFPMSFSGTLITGEVTAFGFLNSGATTDNFDLRFTVTGGALATYYANKDIGVKLFVEQSTFNDFTVNFSGLPKFTIGPIAAPPAIQLLKQISVDGGATWADADNVGDLDVPTVPAPSGAQYRFIVTNTGGVDLVDVVLNDATLGLVNVPLPGGSLAVGESVTIDSGYSGFEPMDVAERCNDAGVFINTADVSGSSSEDGTVVTDENPAVMVCTYTPPSGGGGGQGCTPGYWRQPQHFWAWTAPYTPDTLFGDVFEDAFPGQTLLDVVRIGGGGLNALGRHTVAALLNAAIGDVSYDLTPAEVINAFNDLYPGSNGDYEPWKNQLDTYNNQGCPLNNGTGFVEDTSTLTTETGIGKGKKK